MITTLPTPVRHRVNGDWTREHNGLTRENQTVSTPHNASRGQYARAACPAPAIEGTICKRHRHAHGSLCATRSARRRHKPYRPPGMPAQVKSLFGWHTTSSHGREAWPRPGLEQPGSPVALPRDQSDRDAYARGLIETECATGTIYWAWYANQALHKGLPPSACAVARTWIRPGRRKSSHELWIGP